MRFALQFSTASGVWSRRHRQHTTREAAAESAVALLQNYDPNLSPMDISEMRAFLLRSDNILVHRRTGIAFRIITTKEN